MQAFELAKNRKNRAYQTPSSWDLWPKYNVSQIAIDLDELRDLSLFWKKQ